MGSEPFVGIFFENVSWVRKENYNLSPTKNGERLILSSMFVLFSSVLSFLSFFFSFFLSLSTNRKMIPACEKLFFHQLCTSYPDLCGEINISGDTRKTHPKSWI